MAASETGGKPAAGGRKAGGIRLRVVNAIITIALTILILLLMQMVSQMSGAITELETLDEGLAKSERMAYDLELSSETLTEYARSYVIVGDDIYLKKYISEYSTDTWRTIADELRENSIVDEVSRRSLDAAEQAVRQLVADECYAMELKADADGTTMESLSNGIITAELSEEDHALSAEEKMSLASTMLMSEEYEAHIEAMAKNLASFRSALLDENERLRVESARTMRDLQFQQQVLSVLILAAVLALVLSFAVLVIWPLRGYIIRVRNNEPLMAAGAFELQYLAAFYNAIFEERRRTNAQLKYEAERDQLTGLFNRRAFNNFAQDGMEQSYALLLIDVDHFKEVNDTHGHAVGDDTLKKLGDVLKRTFRSTDLAFRIGGDEFAVVMTKVDESLREVICRKIEDMRTALRDDSDGTLPITVSIGVAFNAGDSSLESSYKSADSALYRVKEAGRNGYAFFGDAADEG